MTLQTASQLDSSTIRQLQQLQQLLIRQTGSENVGASSSSAVPDSVKFNKKVLDYDYDEEEDDDNDRTMTPRNQNNVLSEVRIEHSFNRSKLFTYPFTASEQQHCPTLKRSKCFKTTTKFAEIKTTGRKAIKTD